MTITEAEEIYHNDVKIIKEKHADSQSVCRFVWLLIGIILTIVGIVLLVIGYTMPATLNSSSTSNYVWKSYDNFFELTAGKISLGAGILFVFIGLIYPEFMKPNFLPANKKLYLNYLRCEDLTQPQQLYYTQLLEEIRANQLAKATLNSNNNAVIASMAIMYTMNQNK